MRRGEGEEIDGNRRKGNCNKNILYEIYLFSIKV